MYVFLLLLLSSHMTQSTITRSQIDINRRTRAIARLIFIRKILRTYSKMNSRANTSNSNNTQQSNAPKKYKVSPLIIKKYRLLSEQEKSNSSSPNFDNEFRLLQKTFKEHGLNKQKLNFSQHQIAIHH
jgi:hypothetical protein